MFDAVCKAGRLVVSIFWWRHLRSIGLEYLDTGRVRFVSILRNCRRSAPYPSRSPESGKNLDLLYQLVLEKLTSTVVVARCYQFTDKRLELLQFHSGHCTERR